MNSSRLMASALSPRSVSRSDTRPRCTVLVVQCHRQFHSFSFIRELIVFVFAMKSEVDLFERQVRRCFHRCMLTSLSPWRSGVSTIQWATFRERVIHTCLEATATGGDQYGYVVSGAKQEYKMFVVQLVFLLSPPPPLLLFSSSPSPPPSSPHAGTHTHSQLPHH